MKPDPQVEEYVSRCSGEALLRLNQLRTLTKELVPGAVESFSYGLIGYKLNGKPLVYYGAFRNHIGFYATPNGHEAFVKEFSAYKQGKGSVQLPLAEPLPLDVIVRVIAYRVENLNGKNT